MTNPAGLETQLLITKQKSKSHQLRKVAHKLPLMRQKHVSFGMGDIYWVWLLLREVKARRNVH